MSASAREPQPSNGEGFLKSLSCTGCGQWYQGDDESYNVMPPGTPTGGSPAGNRYEPISKPAEANKALGAASGVRSCLKWTCISCCAILSLLGLYVGIVLLIFAFFSQGFQTWALQQPSSAVAGLFLPPVAIIESLAAGQSKNLIAAQDKYGPNWAAAGMVWMSSFNDTSKAVLEPEERTFHLGEHPMQVSAVPDVSRSRNVFLLALSDKGAGGDGSHEKFKKAFVDWVMKDGVKNRAFSETGKGLWVELIKDYTDLEHNWWGQEFFNSTTRGLTPFVIKYLHYVMWGLDPNDQKLMDKLEEFYSSQLPVGHYIVPYSWITELAHPGLTDLVEDIVSIYEKSPALEEFAVKAEYNNMTKRELAALSVAIMRLAGVTGFSQMAKVTLGAWQMPAYHGGKSYDQKHAWDSLDLENEDEVEKYVLECIRLDAPVSVTHRVATSPFSVDMQGGKKTFPKGTKIAIPLALGNIDRDFWGDDAYEFDAQRPELESNILSFNSVGVGGEAGRRECAARKFVVRSIVHMVTKLGETRRANLP